MAEGCLGWIRSHQRHRMVNGIIAVAAMVGAFCPPSATSKPWTAHQPAGRGLALARGRRLAEPPRRTAKLVMSEKSVDALLREYGVVALSFHFSVWLSSLAVVYSVLTVSGSDLITLLPGNIEGATTKAGQLAAALGIVEAIGPARLALTIAATPMVSKAVRGVPVLRLGLRRADVFATNAVDGLTERFKRSASSE